MKKSLTTFLILILSVSALFAAPRQPKPYKVNGQSNVKVMGGGEEYNAYIGSGNVYFNLKGEYSEVSFVYGYDDSRSGISFEIQVLGDGELLAEYECVSGMLPEKATVNVEYVNQLVINLRSYVQFVADVEFV